MGIFSRVRDIFNANINSMLDKAEDPEKLVKLMIQEMEDTLVEIKASCAGVMAERKKVQRSLDEARSQAEHWAGKAQLAVNRGREDLAREALMEKRRLTERSESLEKEIGECDDLIERYQSDISQVEEKLQAAREKQRMLVQRHIHAQKKTKAQKEIRRFDSSEAMQRFDKFENRIERMEAEADLVNFGKKSSGRSLDEEFEHLEGDEEIEKELAALKEKSGTSGKSSKGSGEAN